jgi:hypothetical protein
VSCVIDVVICKFTISGQYSGLDFMVVSDGTAQPDKHSMPPATAAGVNPTSSTAPSPSFYGGTLPLHHDPQDHSTQHHQHQHNQTRQPPPQSHQQLYQPPPHHLPTQQPPRWPVPGSTSSPSGSGWVPVPCFGACRSGPSTSTTAATGTAAPGGGPGFGCRCGATGTLWVQVRYGERAALVRVTASVTFEDAKKVALREWNIRSRYVCGVCVRVCVRVR